jgi:hypothetical protein
MIRVIPVPHASQTPSTTFLSVPLCLRESPPSVPLCEKTNRASVRLPPEGGLEQPCLLLLVAVG